MNLDSDSSGIDSSFEEGEDAEDIYFDQMKPILRILWHGGISDLPSNERYNKLLHRLSELFLLQYYWDKSDVLVNLTNDLSGQIEYNSMGENIIDFYNAAKIQLRDYLIKYLNTQL